MVFVYYTIAGLLLYFVSDRILDYIEIRLGRRLENRSLVFFFIIMTLSLGSFKVLQTLLVNSG